MYAQTQIAEILRILCVNGVDFILVGGVAAVAHGAPINTFDVDVVYSLAPDNVVRALQAASDLDAVFRGDPRRLKPNASHMATTGHKLLETRLGFLDMLGAIDEGATYERLIADTVLLEVEGMRLKVISLERLIEVKRRTGRAKDALAVPVLEATLAERNRRGD